MDNIFVQLAIILGFSSLFGFIVNKFKLPLLIAYLIGGLAIALTGIFDVKTSQALHFLPDIGIAFVLFLVGMELDLREVKNLGKPILISGLLQIFITTMVGTALAQGFGFKGVEAWYLGVGLSFSSTILVVKLLLDKRDLTALYGKLALGILLLEDLLAVVILLALTVAPSTFNLGYQEAFPLITFVAKVVILFSLSLLLNEYILTAIFRAVSHQAELLFLTALAWCFIYVSFALAMGFSVVIGAFLAGIALASSPYHFQIQGKVKPLRDFFVTLFFVYLGTQVRFSDIAAVYPLILIFSAYTLFLKPTIFLLIFGAFGFRKHTMFKAAISLTHISEFSLIIILVGIKLGLASTQALTVIALSAVLSMLISSVMISNSNKIFKLLQSTIGFFERKNYHRKDEESPTEALSDHVVIIGGHRVGGEIVKFFQKENIPMIVLDFNPDQVEALLKEKINAFYGDIGDPEILDILNLESARLIVSTATDIEDSLLLLEEVRSRNAHCPVIVRATSTADAKILYKAGADYVVIPEVVAGDFLAEKIKDHFKDGDYFKDRPKIEMEKLTRKIFAVE